MNKNNMDKTLNNEFLKKDYFLKDETEDKLNKIDDAFMRLNIVTLFNYTDKFNTYNSKFLSCRTTKKTLLKYGCVYKDGEYSKPPENEENYKLDFQEIILILPCVCVNSCEIFTRNYITNKCTLNANLKGETLTINDVINTVSCAFNCNSYNSHGTNIERFSLDRENSNDNVLVLNVIPDFY